MGERGQPVRLKRGDPAIHRFVIAHRQQARAGHRGRGGPVGDVEQGGGAFPAIRRPVLGAEVLQRCPRRGVAGENGIHQVAFRTPGETQSKHVLPSYRIAGFNCQRASAPLRYLVNVADLEVRGPRSYPVAAIRRAASHRRRLSLM